MADNQVLEVKSDSSVPEAVLTFPLDYNSSFVLFDQIDSLMDCMNLVDAYPGLKPVAERIYKRKFNKLSFDFQQPVDRTLRHAGATAKSLTLSLRRCKVNSGDLTKIRNTCKQLRCLSVRGFERKNFLFNPFANFGKGKLEELTLSRCSLGNDIHFFDKFGSLKCLNIFGCDDYSSIAIERCFKNNKGITSFTCNEDLFTEPETLLFLPHLERLSLVCESGHVRLNMLSQLRSLCCLTLYCGEGNINDVLVDVGKSYRLEELDLLDIDINEATFPLIMPLQSLKQLYVISASADYSFPESKYLPSNLKTLTLEDFPIANGNIASLVKNLRHLENLSLRGCVLLHHDLWVCDFDLTADLIVKDLTEGDLTYRSLNVTIDAAYGGTPNTTKSIGRLRITNDVQDTSLFDITYPGMYRGVPESEFCRLYSD